MILRGCTGLKKRDRKWETMSRQREGRAQENTKWEGEEEGVGDRAEEREEGNKSEGRRNDGRQREDKRNRMGEPELQKKIRARGKRGETMRKWRKRVQRKEEEEQKELERRWAEEKEGKEGEEEGQTGQEVGER